MENFKNSKEISFAFFTSCSSKHGFFLTKKNILFGFGKNDKNQIGIPNKNPLTKPTEVVFFRKKEILKISCCENYSSVLCCTSSSEKSPFFRTEIFSTLKKTQSKPWDILPIEKSIIDISSGQDYTLLLTDEGEVFCDIGKKFGSGDGSLKKKISINEKVVKIKAGGNHSLFLTINSTIFVTGRNIDGRLGIKNTLNQVFPVLLNTPIKFRNLDCGIIFSIFYKKQTIYSCGKNINGNGNLLSLTPIHIKIPKNEKISSIKCGGYTLYVSTSEGEKKKIYLCGKVLSGNDGLKIPVYNLSGLNFIATMHNSCIFLNKDGIYGHGSNAHGQLMNIRKGFQKSIELLTDNYTSNDILNSRTIENFNFIFNEESIKNTKLIQKKEITVKCLNDKSFEEIRILCSYAVQSNYLTKFIEENKFEITLGKEDFMCVESIKSWLYGILPQSTEFDIIKSTYFLAIKWQLPQLSYFLVKSLEKAPIEIVINLIFDLEGKEDSALFLQCKMIIKRNHNIIFKKYLTYIDEKRNEKNMSLVYQIVGGFPVENIPKIEGHTDSTGINVNFNLKDSFDSHICSLLESDITKNLILVSVDRKYIKVHKEILICNEYYRGMLTNSFEESQNESIVELNVPSCVLIPWIYFIYTKNINFVWFYLKQFNILDLLTIEYYFEKHQILALKKICGFEIKLRVIDEKQRKVYRENVELVAQNNDLIFEMKRMNKENEKAKMMFEEKFKKQVEENERTKEKYEKQNKELEESLEKLNKEKEIVEKEFAEKYKEIEESLNEETKRFEELKKEFEESKENEVKEKEKIKKEFEESLENERKEKERIKKEFEESLENKAKEKEKKKIEFEEILEKEKKKFEELLEVENKEKQIRELEITKLTTENENLKEEMSSFEDKETQTTELTFQRETQTKDPEENS